MSLSVCVESVDANGFAQVAHAGGHDVRADEPVSSGGTGTGPQPTELMLASLGACTSITLRMYAARKGWVLGMIEVTVALSTRDEGVHIDRRITFTAPLLPEQRSRLAEISEKTPVTKLLKSGMAIHTVVND